MKILVTQLYETQLKEILEKYFQDDFESAKKFKIYLDTLLINIPTKAQKYNSSSLFNDQNIKEVEYENFLIPFYHNKEESTFLILGIITKATQNNE